MIRLTTAALAFATAALVATEARAQPTIDSGGPRAKSDRHDVERVLRETAYVLDACWQGKRPREVKVAITVDARGRVTASEQRTRGAAAQCAAGIFAVQTFPGTGKPYRLVAAVPTSEVDVAEMIKRSLARHYQYLRACRDEGKARGTARVTLRILADGSVADARVSGVGDARVRRCMELTARKMQLDARPGGKPIRYGLDVDLSADPVASGAAPSGGGGGATQPRKDGPLTAVAINKVMKARKAAFTACYERVVRRQRSLAGRVVLRFTIRDDGTTRNVKVRETTLNNARVERCIVKVGESLKFPGEKGRAKTRVFYPFVFSPR